MTQYDGFQWKKSPLRERWDGETSAHNFIGEIHKLSREYQVIIYVNGNYNVAEICSRTFFDTLEEAQDGAAVMLSEWLTAASDELGVVS